MPGPVGQSSAGHAFQLVATREGENLINLHYFKPVSVTVHYSVQDVSVISETWCLDLWHCVEGEWQLAAQPCLVADETYQNLDERMISTPICTTGQYVLFGPKYQISLSVVSNGTEFK